ncbi:MAG: cytochrome c3 family protein [Planctomycetota bacterium]
MHRLLWLLLTTLLVACSDDPAPSTKVKTRPAESFETSTFEELIAGLPTEGPVPFWPVLPEGDFVGSEVCAECHAEEHALQTATRMNGTGQRITAENREQFFPEQLLEQEFQDPYNKHRYRYRFRDEGVVLEVADRRGKKKAEIPAEWAIGAGGRAFTYVTPVGAADLLELRVSNYTYLDEWGVTPGQNPSRDIRGIQFGARPAERCFDCHGTAIRTGDDGSLDTSEVMGGVQCERCHGPGQAHVDAMLKGEEDETHLLGLQDLPGAQQVALCGQCHRRIEEVDVAEVLLESSSIVRHSGVGITLSECFRARPDELGCLNCHSPHEDSVKDDRSHYDVVCIGCHPGTVQQDGHGGEEGTIETCIGCHMPAVATSMGVEGRESKFVDHWIRVPGKLGDVANPEARLKASPELADLIAGAAVQALRDDPDNHMAYANLGKILKVRGDLDRAAWAFEQSVRIEPSKIPNIGALAMLSMQLRLPGKTREACERILALDPDNEIAGKLLKRVDRIENR